MTNWNDYTPPDPRDSLDRDQVLAQWQKAQNDLAKCKEQEMDWRKYVVKRAFPTPSEGTNSFDLGNGKELKAVVKYNYSLADNSIVEKTLDDIAKIGNQGAFIADRLVSWSACFLLTEYRELQERAKDSVEAQEILAKVGEMLTVSEAAPTVSIKESKKK